MKHTIFLSFFLTLLIAGCTPVAQPPHRTSYIVEGDFNYQGFRDTCHWSVRYDSSYTAEGNNIEILKAKLPGTHMLIYAGTWCGDSKHQVPRMMKILNESGFDLNSLEFRLVDRSKKDKAGHSVQDSIKFIPTFILYRDKKEIGRIVENPKATLEQDLVKMLMKE